MWGWHPNIVEIFDKGEFEEDEKRKPALSQLLSMAGTSKVRCGGFSSSRRWKPAPSAQWLRTQRP